MSDSTTRRRLLFSSLAAGTMAAAGGCGSILFPERVGQPRTGPIDWKVVALDGVGLVFFFVPGLVAFAVDFYNGTLFLPPRSLTTALPAAPLPAAPLPAETATVHQSLKPPLPQQPELPEQPLEAIPLPAGPERRAQVEEILSAHAGQPVVLEPGSYQTRPLDRIDQFWSTLRTAAGLAPSEPPA
ncbi:hypothetical protein [Candidatus Laterigemmans baculatus]|uniref:hypothetical protein n=1 Tax=Candidatus Laterigemmans baculatus TaxID=2770505 RepID=UPI0013DD4632|nr:hypothetical protein [Candidatus Laterigemmans baculatus]